MRTALKDEVENIAGNFLCRVVCRNGNLLPQKFFSLGKLFFSKASASGGGSWTTQGQAEPLNWIRLLFLHYKYLLQVHKQQFSGYLEQCNSKFPSLLSALIMFTHISTDGFEK